MTFIQHPDRRIAARFEKALKVRFSVNGGPEYWSDTINFTARSVAIRSDCPVKKHDKIVAVVDDLPEIKGSVIRVFDEGFAICLNDASLALIAHAGAEIPDTADPSSGGGDQRILSPVFRADAPGPAWGQITTIRTARGDMHFLTVVTTSAMDVNDISNVWVSIDDSRWTARVMETKREHNQAMIMVHLNEWQLRMAAKHGLTFTVISSRLNAWRAHLHETSIDAHLGDLEPQDLTPEDLAPEKTALRA